MIHCFTLAEIYEEYDQVSMEIWPEAAFLRNKQGMLNTDP